MKTPVDFYKYVVQKYIEEPKAFSGEDGRKAYAYVKSFNELRTIFAENGFNIGKDAWNGYIKTWLVAGYVTKIPDTDLYFFTEKGIDSVWGGKTLMNGLRHIAKENDALVLA